MKLILKNDKIGMSVSTLELYIRMHLGQYDEIKKLYRFHCSRNDYEEAIRDEGDRDAYLQMIRNLLMPDLHGFPVAAASRGIFQDITDPRAKDAYDLLQVIRYADAWFRNPAGGNTVDFREPLFAGRYANPACSASNEEENEILTVTLCREQFGVMIEAAEMFLAVAEGRMRDVFTFLTDKDDLLDMAERMERFIPQTVEQAYIDAAKNYLVFLQDVEKNET